MSYHQDSIKRSRKIKRWSLFLVIGIIFYFSSGLILTKSYELLSLVSLPIWNMQNQARGGVSSVASVFKSKESIEAENKKLVEEVDNMKLKLDAFTALQQENKDLRGQMGRVVHQASTSVIATILTGPNIPPYDGMIIDAGLDQGVAVGNRVIYEPNIVLGEISQVFSNSAKVKLYSSNGVQTDVLLPTEVPTHVVALGFGGGNFFIQLPSDISLYRGMRLLIPGSDIYILGVIDYIKIDTITSSQRVLIKYPINIKNVRFVHVIKSPAHEYLE